MFVVVGASNGVVRVYVAAKLAPGFIAGSGTSVHVESCCCIIVGEELFKIGWLSDKPQCRFLLIPFLGGLPHAELLSMHEKQSTEVYICR